MHKIKNFVTKVIFLLLLQKLIDKNKGLIEKQKRMKKMKFTSLCLSLFTLCTYTVVSQNSVCMSDVSDYAFLNGGLSPKSVVSADFNKDGKMDIATANYNSNNISVATGLGTGYFNAAVNYAVTSNPVAIATADFNNDTKADLVVTDWGGNFSVLLGNGTGGFAAPIVISGYSDMASIATGDFNKDGKMDVVVTGYWAMYIFTGDGTGNLTYASSFSAGTHRLM